MRMTLNGMLQFNPNLFKGVVLPEGLDSNIMVTRIMDHCGDLYPYIQHPMKVEESIGKWFDGMYQNFYMMFHALNNEYNPVENTDWTSTTSREKVNTGEDSSKSNFESNPASSVTTSQKTNAYNSSSGTPRSETITSNSGKDTTKSDGSSEFSHNETEDFTERRHGNIGVQTTAQIITMEMEMREKFNLYDEITKLFEKEFIVQLY